MNLTTEQNAGVAIVRVGETRMMYPLLADFSGAVAQLLAAGSARCCSTSPRSPTWTAPRSAA